MSQGLPMARTKPETDRSEVSGADDGADASGWPLHSSERRDFWNRIRVFPPGVVAWRKRLLQTIPARPDIFPQAGGSRAELGLRLDTGISLLRETARLLALLYGTPDLGNKKDPTDELVFIILARKTFEGAYQKIFTRLKRRYRKWDDLLAVSPRQVERLIFSGGLSKKKTASLYAALTALRSSFGSCTLEPARAWPDERLESFLCGLPEIERKSAYCIMMYAFGRQVFPVDTHVGRILARLGLYRELGLDLTGLDHKQLQKILADLIPPNLRYSLHVNLVTHGRQMCRSQNPLCQACELRNLCQYYRRRIATEGNSLPSTARREGLAANAKPTIVDLFAGAGGSSEGFTRAGFRVLAAVDQDEMAVRTYRLNHPSVPDDHVLGADIRTLPPGTLRRMVGRTTPDVLIGSPPCQGFSLIGFRSKPDRSGNRPEHDERNQLFEWMVAAAKELRPRLFLMENVPGIQSARREDLSYLEAAAGMLQEQGYRTEIWRLNASAFGVPQDRIRCFLVASRLKVMPARPIPEYQDPRRPDLDSDALPPVTLEEAIFDLPLRQANDGQTISRWQPSDPAASPRCRRYLAKFGLLRSSPILWQHTVRFHNERDLELYGLLRPGEDSVHFLERHRRPDLMRYRRDVFDDKYARLRPDRPCKTIVAHLAKDGNGYIHPYQARSLSLREAARVQSFHDGYVFCGPPSEQWIQLGNAVPPVLAEAIARSFLRVLKRS